MFVLFTEMFVFFTKTIVLFTEMIVFFQEKNPQGFRNPEGLKSFQEGKIKKGGSW